MEKNTDKLVSVTMVRILDLTSRVDGVANT